jgi:AcrR family transcriptional regulator
MSEPAIADNQDVNRAQRRAGRTHKRLLDSALVLFTEKGIDACSVEMITEKADLGKGTFYRHFDDKYAIVNALLTQVLSQLIERIAKKTSSPVSWETAAGLIIDEHAAFFIENPTYHGFILQTRIIGHIRETLDQKNNSPVAAYLAVIEKIFKPLLPDTLSPLQLRRLVCALSGSIMGFLAFAGIGMKREEVSASLPILRDGFLKGAGAWVNHTL